MNNPVYSFSTSARLVFALIGITLLSGCDSPEERAQSHYESGLELVEQGEPVKASLEFRNALKLKEDFVPALFALGKVEHERNQYQRAARMFARVAEQAPEHVDARVRLSRILLLAGQLDEALKYADQAYALARTNSDVLVLKAAIALKLGNRNDAVRFADAVLDAEPENFDALIVRASERLAANDPRGALAFLDKGTEKHDRNVGLQLFRMKSLAALSDNDGIEQVFAKLIDYYPENARFRYGLASWYIRAGRKEDAERVFRKFAADNPDDVQIGLQLVRFLAQEKGMEAARTELEARIADSKAAFDYRMALAEMTFRQGQHDQAVDLLQGLIKDTETSENKSKAQVLLAGVHVSKNRLEEAEKLVASVLEDDATNVSALQVRASVLVARKQYTEAIENLSVALNEAPESARLLQILAQVYELNGSVELARDHFAKAAKIERFQPQVALNFVRFLLRYGRSNQAERVLAEIRRVAPGNREVLTLLARLRLARQDWLGAHEIADVLRKLEDNTNTADLILAEALSGQQKFGESIKLLQDSVLDPSDPNTPVASLVQLYVRSGQPEQAEQFLNTVLEANPNNLQAEILLASLHELGGRKPEAEAAFKAVVDKHPKSVVAHGALAEFHLRSGRMDAAEAAVRSGLEHQSKNLRLRLLSALIHEQAGRYEEAITEYEAMFEEQPRSTIVANNLASLLADHRDDEASIEKAHSIAVRFRDSTVPQFLDTLGWVYYRKGDYDDAVTLLKTAAEKLPNVELVHYHLGMAYKKIGRKELAIESLEKAITLAGDKEFPQRQQVDLALDQLRSASEAKE